MVVSRKDRAGDQLALPFNLPSAKALGVRCPASSATSWREGHELWGIVRQWTLHGSGLGSPPCRHVPCLTEGQVNVVPCAW
jgi:hypothetical protein